MSFILIIRGAPASGKSTISKIISKKLNFKIIHYDRFITGCNLGIKESEDFIPLDRLIKVNKLLISKIKKWQEHDIDLIIEGNFYFKEQLNNLIKQINSDYKVFNIKANKSTCIKRDLQRIGTVGKYVVSNLYDLEEEFDYEEIINSEDNSPIETAKIILKKIT